MADQARGAGQAVSDFRRVARCFRLGIGQGLDGHDEARRIMRGQQCPHLPFGRRGVERCDGHGHCVGLWAAVFIGPQEMEVAVRPARQANESIILSLVMASQAARVEGSAGRFKFDESAGRAAVAFEGQVGPADAGTPELRKDAWWRGPPLENGLDERLHPRR